MTGMMVAMRMIIDRMRLLHKMAAIQRRLCPVDVSM